MILSIFERRQGARRLRARSAYATALLALFLLGLLVMLVGGAAAAATSVQLGTAGSFAVLAGSGISNTGPTTVNGDLGTFPTTTVDGAASITVTGTNHGGDAVTQGAKSDLVTAYNTAAGEGPTTPIAADLAGQTLTAGVYNSASSIGLSGALTLNGGGDPNAVFVFQAGSSLITASGSSVNLINGAQSCNVFWQVGSSATLGTGSTFRGTILALTSITVTTAVTIDGRVLARNGAITLDTDTIIRSACAAPAATATTPVVPPPATTTAATTATTATPVPNAAARARAARAKAAASARAATAARERAATKKRIASSTQIGTARLPRVRAGFTG
jgi:type VI secretion system secreted protein VgrG